MCWAHKQEGKNLWFLPSWNLWFSMAVVSETIKHPLGCLYVPGLRRFSLFLLQCPLAVLSTYFSSASFMRASFSITAVYSDIFLSGL